MKDKLKASLLLSSLPDSYSGLITSLETRNETDFTADFVKERVIDEYKRRKEGQGSESSSEAALKTVFKKPVQGKGQKECFFCKRMGHFKKDCSQYEKWKTGKDKQDKDNKVTEEP